MAAVFIPPSPQTNFQMATRRPPLAHVPNATNSPHANGFVSSKRPRTQGSQLELAQFQPPAKKQLRDDENAPDRSPSRKTISYSGEGKVFTRKNVNAPPTAFERKLVAAREKDKQGQSKTSRTEKQSGNSRDNLLQWQRHYRKAFPQFVFYFEGMTTEVHRKCSRQVHALGASEEKFFSRYVTHVVTARPIPQDLNSPNTEAAATSEERRDGTVQTVNPSLLDKHHSKTEHPSNADILFKAREMGMKIWALEKLQRMISTMNDTTAGGHHGHNTRSHNGGEAGKGRGDNELSQVLRNERINGPSDRDPSAIWRDIIPFKGPFIYIHDVEEKTRPALVRDYPKVAKRQDGIWPQFRSAPLGKCPFVEEPLSKKEAREKAVSKPQKDSKAAATRYKPAETENKNMDPPGRSFEKKAAEKVEARIEEPEKQEDAPPLKPAEPPTKLPTKIGSPKKSSESVVPPGFTRPGQVYFRGEPAASGVQPSNITSAIRSQMISSTAAAPGGKAGTSREVHELKRKVLEKSNGSLSTGGGISSSHRMTDVPGSFKNTKAPVTRLAKARAEKQLGQIDEEEANPSIDDGSRKREAPDRKHDIPQKKKEARRDPKPGYCENCRDKFDDFDEHVMTRKHRKFAANKDNWGELDDLLWALQREVKSSC